MVSAKKFTLDATSLIWMCHRTDFSSPRSEQPMPRGSSAKPKMARNTASSNGSGMITGEATDGKEQLELLPPFPPFAYASPISVHSSSSCPPSFPSISPSFTSLLPFSSPDSEVVDSESSRLRRARNHRRSITAFSPFTVPNPFLPRGIISSPCGILLDTFQVDSMVLSLLRVTKLIYFLHYPPLFCS